MNTNTGTLSLASAIFINLNIMVGIGLFLNTTVLASKAGASGFVSYALLAVLLLPLILSIARLVRIYPEGGFYTYATEAIHPVAGFISAWSYFTAKLSSATIMIHASILLLQQIIPVLNHVNIYALDVGMLALFIAFNMYNLKTGTSVQLLFLGMKLIPIFFVILTGLFLFSPINYQPASFQWSPLVSTLPLVIFAAIGFEATTSISRNIKNSSVNGPRAILISYTLVMLINITYQALFYGSLGVQLETAVNFTDAFPLLLDRLFASSHALVPTLQAIFNIAIASSALGGAFGILFSNSWNLHTLALHKHIAKSKWFLIENKHGIPFACVLAEGALCLVYLAATGADQIPLQQIAAFGCTISYTISILSLLVIALKKAAVSPWLPLLALCNCALFLMASLDSFFTLGAQSLYLFSAILIAGIAMYGLQAYQRRSA